MRIFLPKNISFSQISHLAIISTSCEFFKSAFIKISQLSEACKCDFVNAVFCVSFKHPDKQTSVSDGILLFVLKMKLILINLSAIIEDIWSRSEDFQTALADELAAGAIKEQEVVAAEAEVDVVADGEIIGAEDNGGQQVGTVTNFQGIFTAAGHGSVDFAAKRFRFQTLFIHFCPIGACVLNPPG